MKWRDKKCLINIRLIADSRVPKTRCFVVCGSCQHALPDPFCITPGACGNFLLLLAGSCTVCASVVSVAQGRQQVCPGCCLVWGRGCRAAGRGGKEKRDEWVSEWLPGDGVAAFRAVPVSSQRASVCCLLGPCAGDEGQTAPSLLPLQDCRGNFNPQHSGMPRPWGYWNGALDSSPSYTQLYAKEREQRETPTLTPQIVLTLLLPFQLGAGPQWFRELLCTVFAGLPSPFPCLSGFQFAVSRQSPA